MGSLVKGMEVPRDRKVVKVPTRQPTMLPWKQGRCHVLGDLTEIKNGNCNTYRVMP